MNRVVHRSWLRGVFLVVGSVGLVACGQGRPVADESCDAEGCAAPTAAGYCSGDADCSAGEVCLGGWCVVEEGSAPSCASHQDCPVGLFCDVDGGACVECLTSAHCDPGQRCNPAGSCVLGGCTSDADCAPEVCEVESARCVECLTHDDCAAGQTCVSFTCIGGQPAVGERPAPGELVINEVLADPPGDDGSTTLVEGDANGDGLRGTYDDEFIELVNASARDLDLADCTVTVKGTLRHRFAATLGTTLLGAGRALVIFGGGAPSGNFGGALVLTASTGTLILANDGGWATLDCPGASATVEVDRFDYGSGANDQSWTRAVEGDAQAPLVKHLTIRGSPYSPGACASGVAFPACLP